MANAPRKTQRSGGLTPATPQPQTMVHGFAIQILAFIPIPKDDLRKQAEIPLLLLDINEGKKTLADLVPHLKGIEFRQQHTGRRMTVADVEAWKKADSGQTDLETEIAKKKAEDEAKAAAAAKKPDSGDNEDDN